MATQIPIKAIIANGAATGLAQFADSDTVDAGNLPGASVYIGTFSRDLATASGQQTVTGVGFRAKFVIFIGTVNVAAGMLSLGFGVAGTGKSVADAHVTFANSYTYSSTALYIYQGSGINHSLNINSFTDDGFILDCVKTGSTTGVLVVQFVAVR